MTDETDYGIDRQKILAEIGASAPLPGEAPKPPPPPEPVQAAPPAPPFRAVARDHPDVPIRALAPPELPAAPAPAIPPPPFRPQGRFARHRRQIAGFVLAFVGLLWCGVALATDERVPLVIGGGLLGLATLIGVGSLLREA